MFLSLFLNYLYGEMKELLNSWFLQACVLKFRNNYMLELDHIVHGISKWNCYCIELIAFYEKRDSNLTCSGVKLLSPFLATQI